MTAIVKFRGPEFYVEIGDVGYGLDVAYCQLHPEDGEIEFGPFVRKYVGDGPVQEEPMKYGDFLMEYAHYVGLKVREAECNLQDGAYEFMCERASDRMDEAREMSWGDW